MKHIITFTIFVFLITLTSYSQSIPASEAGKNIGKKLTVCDKVYGGRYLENASGTPTVVAMGAAYPDNTFSFMILGDDRKKFSYKPEEYLVNKEVCITGEIRLYREKPQIVVTDTTQVVLKK
jgi:hypothetical protein